MFNFGLIILSFGVFFFAIFTASRTSFGRRPMDPGPFWVQTFLEVPVFILPGVLLASLESVRDLWIFRNVDANGYYVAAWALYYGLLAYFGAILLIDRLANRVMPQPTIRRAVANRTWIFGILLMWQCLSLSVVFVIVPEVPLIGLFAGAEVGILRKAATQGFSGPAFLLSFIKLYGLLGVFVLAVTKQTLHIRVLRALMWIMSLLCLSWSGEKSPVVIALLGYWLLRVHHERRQLTLKQLALAAAFTATAALGIYILFLETDNLLNGLWFFGIRTFLGQISGYFQALSNFTPDSKYLLSWVPFGGTFSDQLPIFARDLMLMTEGDTETSGNLNTLFLAEAYGVGGWPLLLFSPLIVALSIVMSLHILRYWLTRKMGAEIAECGVYLFVMNSWLTSGMASFPALRSLMVVSFVLGTIVIPYHLLRSISHSKNLKIAYPISV